MKINIKKNEQNIITIYLFGDSIVGKSKLSAKYLGISFDKWAMDDHHIATKNEII